MTGDKKPAKVAPSPMGEQVEPRGSKKSNPSNTSSTVGGKQEGKRIRMAISKSHEIEIEGDETKAEEIQQEIKEKLKTGELTLKDLANHPQISLR